MKTSEQLDQEILQCIGQGIDCRDEEQFNRLALSLFEYQFAANLPYRNFCRHCAKAPDSISSWKEIPAVPTSAFKETALACFPVEQAAAIFETSGTTRSIAKRGRHYLQNTALYRASIIPNFAAHLLPDALSMPMLMLAPSPEEAPHSSLSFMMGVVAEQFGARGNHYFVRANQLEALRLSDTMRMAEGFEQPVMVLGTAFSFVHFFEFCNSHRQYFKLPAGSRAMETGGFKGTTREISREELLQLFEEYLFLSADHVINEYGMTELGAQFYDSKLRAGLLNHQHPALKFIPPWSRVIIVNPASGSEVSEGERGLIRVYDLTNRSSVFGIQTEDIGVRRGEGFEVLGRARGAETRGCSVAAEEFALANEADRRT